MNGIQTGRAKKILEHYGFDHQQEKLVEECKELIQAAQNDDWDNFIEELADVQIMVTQMLISLNSEQQKQFVRTIDFKLDRQLRRIENGT